jgi:hypothetical protein
LLSSEEESHRLEEERNIVHTTIHRRKANWISHILRRSCLLKDVTEGKIEGRYKSVSHEMQHLAVFILFHTGLLYMFRVLFAPIIRSSKNCMLNHWYET